MDARRRPTLALAAMTGYGVVLALVAWWPRQLDANDQVIEWSVIRTMAHLLTVQPVQVLAGVEVSAHLALFVPLGVLIAWRWQPSSAGTVIIVASAVALLIETVQWIAPIDRTPSAVDLLADVAGSLLGFATVHTVRHHPRAGATMIGGLVVAAVAVAAVLVWGMAVSTT